MIRISHHKKFKKSFRKLRRNEIKRFEERVELFTMDPHNKVLNNHRLNGNLAKYRSINIAGDLRVVFEMVNKDTAVFIDIDTHSNLYL